MPTLEIHLSAKEFLHLKTLVTAFEAADDEDAKAIQLKIKGLGTISWEQHKEVVINLEKEVLPGAKTK